LLQAMPPATRTATERGFDKTSAPFDSVLRLMAARKIVFDPTLFVFQSPAANLTIAGAVTRRAHELGVPVAAGTDSIAAADAHSVPNIHREMELLVAHAGFTPGEAIIAATHNGALVLGVAAKTGVVATGMRADIVILRANPLEDIRNTRQIELVIKHGVIYRR
ncbi:MAG: amidohydrolase family protein, partial [Gemmatimonadaceae bacterium]